VITVNQVWITVNHIIHEIKEEVSIRTGRFLCKPAAIYLWITPRCFFQCKMCDWWREPHDPKEELTTDEWKKILLDLRRWLGPFQLNISGGEPFIRSDLLDITRFAVEVGIQVGVGTNAWLIDRNLAEEIVDSGLFNIGISLDGIKAETHDFIRGRSGAYERVMAAIDYLDEARKQKKSDLRIIIKPIIMGFNLDEMPELVIWAQKRRLNGVNFNPLINITPECKDLEVQDFDRLDKTLNELISLKQAGYPILTANSHFEGMKTYFRNPKNSRSNEFICRVGLRNFFVDHDGDVYFCHSFPAIGNVRHSTAREIWNSAQAEQIRQQILKCKKSCFGTCVVKRSLSEKVDLFLKLFARQGRK